MLRSDRRRVAAGRPFGRLLAAMGALGCDAGAARVDSSVDGGADLGCESETVDATVGACRLPLMGATFDCAASWAEQRTRGCQPGVVVFVSADSAPAGQLIWFERPWFSGGTSCFYDPTTELLIGAWYVTDNPTHCCRTSYDVTYGDFDPAAHDAAVRAAQPLVGRIYDTSGTEAVDGGEVRFCASVAAGI